MSRAAVSVARRTVGCMAEHGAGGHGMGHHGIGNHGIGDHGAQPHVHTCVFFDDGDPELLCVCGGRGMVLVEDDSSEGMLVALLDDGDASTPRPEVLVLRRELAISA
jgi:hypothetical protein